MLVQFFGFENLGKFPGGQILFGGMSESGAIFLRLCKATATGAIFHPQLQCNFQNCYCVAIARESLQHGYTSTWCDGKIC